VNNYIVEVKPPARKELEALPDNVLSRAVRKLESLAGNPRPAGCKKLKGYKEISGASGWVTGAWYTSSTIRRNSSV
jgi:hypothetical protein